MRLPTASYNQPGRSPTRLVNCYAQASVGKTPVEIVGAPGIVTLCVPTYSGDTTTGRGLLVVNGQMYAIVGQSFYTVSESGTYTRVGEVLGDARVMMAADGISVVTDGGYIYDGSTIYPITDIDRPDFEAVDFSDGRILYVETDSGRFGASGLYDAGNYDGLDFATAEGSPDDLVTLIVDHREAILFGRDSTERWYNAGSDGFPYLRAPDGFIEIGIIGRHARCKADNSVFWLASDRTIRRLSGATPIRVSQHGVEEAIASYGTVDDCEAFSWTWDGHIFVAFRFPTEERCWVLDVTTGEWHERASYGEDGWDVAHAVVLNGRVYVLNAHTGAIGYLSDTSHQEFGGILRREVTFPSVYSGQQRLFHSALDLTFRTGDAPVDVSPTVLLQYSDDGGSTWNAMPDRELGDMGEYRKVVRWHRLGMARDRVYRVSVSDAVPFHLLDSNLAVAPGAP